MKRGITAVCADTMQGPEDFWAVGCWLAAYAAPPRAAAASAACAPSLAVCRTSQSCSQQLAAALNSEVCCTRAPGCSAAPCTAVCCCAPVPHACRTPARRCLCKQTIIELTAVHCVHRFCRQTISTVVLSLVSLLPAVYAGLVCVRTLTPDVWFVPAPSGLGDRRCTSCLPGPLLHADPPCALVFLAPAVQLPACLC
jgi:hypothetical protein